MSLRVACIFITVVVVLVVSCEALEGSKSPAVELETAIPFDENIYREDEDEAEETEEEEDGIGVEVSAIGEVDTSIHASILSRGLRSGKRRGPCMPGEFLTRGGYCGACKPTRYCPDGVNAILCPPGFYCKEKGATSPVPCSIGSFCPQGVERPFKCPKEMTSDLKASICGFSCKNSEACKKVDRKHRRHRPPCKSGEFITLGGYCRRCLPGFYCNNKLQIYPCPAGYSCPKSGTVVPLKCKINTYCPVGTQRARKCPKGTSSTSGSTSCQLVCETTGDCLTSSNPCEQEICSGLGLKSFLCTKSPHEKGAAAGLVQTPGDCKKVICDGSGGNVTVEDNSDIPISTNKCLTPVCITGESSFSPSTPGTVCVTNTGSTGICGDGLNAGVCGACQSNSECPMSESECQHSTCNSGQCGFEPMSAGLVVSIGQVFGDCKTVGDYQ